MIFNKKIASGRRFTTGLLSIIIRLTGLTHGDYFSIRTQQASQLILKLKKLCAVSINVLAVIQLLQLLAKAVTVKVVLMKLEKHVISGQILTLS